MTVRPTEQLIDALSADAKPVKPLASPLVRALATLAGLALTGLIASGLLPHIDPLAMRGSGRELQAGMELAAVLATGISAVIAAFHLAIPGRSRRWLFVPLPALAAWLAVSGLGCWDALVRNGPSGWELGHSMECLGFIMTASVMLGIPLAWLLSRAAPIDPLPVAALGGLGVAALSAFVLQFFHAFAVTFMDLALHLFAVLIVMALASAFRRPMLQPA